MAQDLHPLRLRHLEAQALALVRAVEETDRRGALVPHHVRRAATAMARAAGDDDAWLARRAVGLVSELEGRWAFLPRLLRFTNPGRGLLLPALVAALLLGLATNALGPQRHVHVLALPLAGILLWNLVVLALSAVRRWMLLGSSAWREARPRLLDAVEGWSRRLVGRLPPDATPEPDLVTQALAAYLDSWLPVVAPLAVARVRRLLHMTALTLLAGVVAGMYLRGVVFEYRPTWESTFVNAAQVDAILGVVLGPAAAILGMDMPSAAAIGPADTAALWIHLWAVTAALFVGLPRAFLALVESVAAARLARRLPIAVPEVYLRRLLAAVSTTAHGVEVVPYSYRLPAPLADALRARLLDVFGARAQIRVRSPVAYGTAAGELELAGGRCCLVLFNLAQTPEIEVHGELLTTLRDELADGQLLLAVVDGSAYRERLAPGATLEKRWAERRRAWDRVVAAAGLEALHLDLRRDPADAVVAALLAAADQ